jgi:hypothetical protein
MLQLLDRDLDVNLGGREFGMAKELLDKADIRAAFRHQRDGTSGRSCVCPVPPHHVYSS